MTSQENNPPEKNETEDTIQKIQIKEGLNIKEISDQLEVRAKDILTLLNREGFSITVSDPLTPDIARSLSDTLELEIEIISIEDELNQRLDSRTEELELRPPVVTIMGHVDHGKTTLLDAFRESNLVGKESGGITQHIGAYIVTHNNHPITFVDTPGHEAFTQLRARGAKVTDIIILVVAADDGVMPQTKEAISHAKAAEVPIIVAINKVDKANADVDKTKQQLSKEGLLVEDWGGDVVSVEVSATEKTNMKELLDMILLVSEVNEIKANPNGEAQGVVLEARLDAKKGAIATVIIQNGTLKQGEAFISGVTHGKVRALFDEKGGILKEAKPSIPVEILGFIEVPVSGDIFQVVQNIETAKKISQLRKSQTKDETDTGSDHLTLDELFQKIEVGEVKELPLVIKGDVQGSIEVLSEILPNLSLEEVQVKIIHAATGSITESDVLLASASNAILIGYNVKANQKIQELANKEGIEIRTYSVIYKLTDHIKKALTGLLDPILTEKTLGRAEIRKIFQIPRIGVIAGCYVQEGTITRNAEIKILRDNVSIHQGKLSSLKHVKENVNEVKKNYECGIGIDKFVDIQEGDIIEAFVIEKEYRD
ncbi:MAG: translation initiation factor IF-2 [Deltaproteobacteria bacterium]|nr:translation initiation factor IF-2 [Deltaproteobacteria bacterium]